MLMHLEKYSFKASYLQEIKKGIRDSQGREVYKQIERLSVLIAPITSRRNAFYAFFNIVALRDFQYMIALEKWKQQSGQALGEWFDALAEMEVLASLAVIRFENPDWVMPTVFAAQEAQANETNKAVFVAVALGHPLLPAEKRKHNDLIFKDKEKVLLITGSNMSGKSTLYGLQVLI